MREMVSKNSPAANEPTKKGGSQRFPLFNLFIDRLR
jgi:hypothetical protein